MYLPCKFTVRDITGGERVWFAPFTAPTYEEASFTEVLTVGVVLRQGDRVYFDSFVDPVTAPMMCYVVLKCPDTGVDRVLIHSSKDLGRIHIMQKPGEVTALMAHGRVYYARA